jgi:hypothetical protein
MNDITTVSAPLSWYLREIPASVKFSSEATDKINTLIANQIVINNYLDRLLVGSKGGTEPAPATLPMAVPSSPTGWSRDMSILNDQILTISNSSGLTTGGNWSMTGGMTLSTDGAHTHTTGSHIHDLSHAHTSINHSHAMSHTHNLVHTHIINLETVSTGQASEVLRTATGRYTNYVGDIFTAYNATLTGDEHTHSIQHQHIASTETVALGSMTPLTTAEAAAVYSTYSGNTSATTNDTTTSEGGHTHSVTGDSSWRPRYMNMIMCRKD